MSAVNTSIEQLMNPHSIAVVGASSNPNSFRGRLFSTILHYNFQGDVIPVSRSERSIHGLTCISHVSELPQTVDLAILAIPAQAVAGVLEECAKIGIKAFLIVSSGFADEGSEEGTVRNEQVSSIVKEYGLTVLGPNSEGFVNFSKRLAATFSPVFAPTIHDKSLVPQMGARIALLSQSGGVGFGLYDR